MKKKNTSRLKLVKIKVCALSKPVPENEKERSLVTTRFISCGETQWVC
ncbi:hypothetical protein [Chitinophaga vietnamensis]|nr:hypothetical protein [Chitinophaga vietnamensis]